MVNYNYGNNTPINVNDQVNINKISSNQSPQGTPNTDKNFRTILDNDDDENDKEDDSSQMEKGKNQPIAMNEPSNVPTIMSSVFDLSKQINPKTKTLQGKTAIDKLPTQTNSMETTSDQLAESGEAKMRTNDLSSKTEKFSSKTDFLTEQPDLSSVNPLALSPLSTGLQANILEQVDSQIGQTTSMTSQSVQDLVDQIDKMYRLIGTDQSSQIETTLQLKLPNSVFDQVNVTLTEFKSAPKEFNITFTNLTSAGQNLIQMNQDSLRLALEQKGILVHIITASTEPASTQGSDINYLAKDTRKDEESKGGQGGLGEKKSK